MGANIKKNVRILWKPGCGHCFWASFFQHFFVSIFFNFFYGIFDKKIEFRCFAALFFTTSFAYTVFDFVGFS